MSLAIKYYVTANYDFGLGHVNILDAREVGGMSIGGWRGVRAVDADERIASLRAAGAEVEVCASALARGVSS